MQRAIFVSYRRDDAEGEAGRLYDDLVRAFGPESVFIDVAGIAPGIDFRKAIDDNVAACAVFLALIGPRWADIASMGGSRRLDNPNDFVRLEIASALARNIPVIPVLVHGARMPSYEQLPANLQDLAFRNSVELSHIRWNTDVDRLLHAIKPYIEKKSSADKNPTPPSAETQETAFLRLYSARQSRFRKNALIALAAALCIIPGIIYPLARYFSRPKAPLPVSTSQPPVVQDASASSVKPPALKDGDQVVAQMQKSLSDAAAGSLGRADSASSKAAVPDLPFRNGPPLIPGSINGRWISMVPSPESFATKIVISGTGRYRTLYVLGSCGKHQTEWTTPDADFVHGKLMDTYHCSPPEKGDHDYEVYFTMYLTAKGLFMHAERHYDQANPGSPKEEEVGYYENASASQNSKE